MTAMRLNIAHLYGDLMNIYGDRGNILTLTQRSRWRGIEATVANVSIGDPIDPDHYDLYFFGGGQDNEQFNVADDMQKPDKAAAMRHAADSGAVFLAICGGYQLLGNYYRPFDAAEIPGIGIIDVSSVASHDRMIGNAVVETPEFGTLVGFENHSAKTFVGPQARPFGTNRVGAGNNGADGSGGAVQRNVYGCYLHGSLLPKNPRFADHLITLALQRHYGEFALPPLDDTLEEAAHAAAVRRAIATH